MAHSDVLIFLVNVSWITFIFIFLYLLLVLFILPTFYKKIRFRQFMEHETHLDFIETVRYYFIGYFTLIWDSELFWASDTVIYMVTRLKLLRVFILKATFSRSRALFTFLPDSFQRCLGHRLLKSSTGMLRGVRTERGL